MGKTVFVPLTDDLLYDHPERILGPVIPFNQKGRQPLVEYSTVISTALGSDANIELEKAIPKLANR